VGSSSEVNLPVNLTTTEDMKEKLDEFDETRGKPGTEKEVAKTHDSSRDFTIESSGVSRSIHQLCVIITEAAEEDNHEGNKEVDLQVDKLRSNSKKEKEKIHISTREWRIIMSAINHGTEVPADSRRKVLMGYQYALHQHKKKLREERDMFMRSRGDNSTSSGGYWDEYGELRKKSKRTAVRRGRRLRSRNTRSSVGSSTGVPTNHTTRAWRSTRAYASGCNTKPRVGRRQVNGKASRGKGDTSKGKAKRRIQAKVLAK
jgi:hypothetical protein